MGGAALAGCSSSEPTIPGEEYPRVDEWLSTADVGDPDETYDGTISDRRGTDEARVDVGAEGNHGWFAFAPSAVAVSPGTTVRWVWTGEEGAHSVRAAPAEQLGISGYTFDSGDPTGEAGHEFTRTFEDPGLALYHCDGITSVHWRAASPRQLEAGVAPLAPPNRRRPPTDRAARAGLHYTPHLQMGMKGAIVVTE